MHQILSDGQIGLELKRSLVLSYRGRNIYLSEVRHIVTMAWQSQVLWYGKMSRRRVEKYHERGVCDS